MIGFHRANIMRKLNVKNAADLVRKVVGNGDPRENNN
jgi:DNA-binding CsgD family transcriptional regulator